jgi:hypothetical protein
MRRQCRVFLRAAPTSPGQGVSMTDIPFDSGAEPVRLGRAQRRRKLALTIAGLAAALMLPFVRTIGARRRCTRLWNSPE